MNNLKNKLVSAFLIFSVTSSLFFVSSNDFILPVMAIESFDQEGDVVDRYSLGDLISSGEEKLSIRAGSFLQLTLNPNSQFQFLDYNNGNLISGSAVINSIYDYSMSVGTGKILNLNDSTIYLKKEEDVYQVATLEGVASFDIFRENYFLPSGYSLEISKETNKKDSVFDFFDSVAYQEVEVLHQKNVILNPEIYYFPNKNSKSFSYEDLLIFEGKKIENKEIDKINLFNSCAELISKFTKDLASISQVKNVCTNKLITSDFEFSKFLLRNIYSVTNLEKRYELLGFFKQSKGSDFLLEDRIFFLARAFEEGEMSFAKALLKEIADEVASYTKNDIKNSFFLLDSIMNKNSDLIGKQDLAIRSLFVNKIFSNEKDLTPEIVEKVFSIHFAFADTLFSSAKYDKLDTLLTDSAFLLLANSETYEGLLNKFRTDTKLFMEAGEKAKNTHGSAISKDVEKEIEKRKKFNEEIKELVSSIDLEKKEVPLGKVEKEKVVSLLSNYGLKVSEKNISAFIDGGSLFSLKNVSYRNFAFNADFSYLQETFFNIKTEELEVEGSLPLSAISKVIKGEFESKALDKKPSKEVIASITSMKNSAEKETVIKKEIIKKYLLSKGIFVDLGDMEIVSESFYRIKNAYIESGSDRASFSFGLVPKRWEVSDIELKFKGEQELVGSVTSVSDLAKVVENSFEIFNTRTLNKSKLYAKLAMFNVRKTEEEQVKEISFAEGDGFYINTEIKVDGEIGYVFGLYFVETDTFESVKLTLKDFEEEWNGISTQELKTLIEDFSSDYIEARLLEEQRAKEVEKRKQEQKTELEPVVDYQQIPDELINGAWIGEF